MPKNRPELKRDDILRLLFDTPYEELRSAAEAVCLAEKGSHVNVRGLIEFSNVCQRNCRYCGLQHGNHVLHRYHLSRERILECAGNAVAAGVDTIVLQSGEVQADPSWLARVVGDIKTCWPVAVTLSVGEHPEASYALWKEAGADRFLIKHETADPELYARLHPGYTLTERLDALRCLQKLGYEAGSGFIVGVPGQRPETLADDILLARDMGVAMCGAGPFIPQKDTPLGGQPRGTEAMSLRVMAVLRLALPWANLPATTALATLDPVSGQREGLRAGGNVLMIGFTPVDCREDYCLYDNKHRVGLQEADRSIREAGRTHTLNIRP